MLAEALNPRSMKLFPLFYKQLFVQFLLSEVFVDVVGVYELWQLLSGAEDHEVNTSSSPLTY